MDSKIREAHRKDYREFAFEEDYADLIMDRLIAELIPISLDVEIDGTQVWYLLQGEHNIKRARAICEAQPGEFTWQIVEW